MKEDSQAGPKLAAGEPFVPVKALFADRYLISAELGRGGMGVVYRAEDTRLKRPVALKFLAGDLAAQPEARVRFLREAQSAANLDNPHVGAVYEAGEHEGRAYIVMAFIDGPTLKERIARGPLSIDEVVGLARQLADGLAAAHAKGIIHRDIKPANVILAGGTQAKITDFGLARFESSNQSTRTAGLIGTLAYMSPEQAQGLEADARTDVWALGSVIYEMLTGRAPFVSDHGRLDFQALISSSPQPVTACRPETPSGLVALVDRCLRKDPQQRYPDSGAVAVALAGIAPGSPAPAAGVPSVAVLPFVDMSPDQSQEYFGEGIAEELIHALARLKGLRVVARTSAFAVAGKGLDVPDIGRLLNVGAVLEGSVRSSGRRLRITAQLIDVATGYHLWSERYDRDAGDIFAIQDELAVSIVEHLRVALGFGEREALRKRSTDDHAAYNLYLKGLYFLARPRPDLLRQALRFFREALEADPGFARAWVGTGLAYACLGNLNFAPPTEAWAEAKAALRQALAIDGQAEGIHGLAASVAFWFDWDWTAAEASFREALAANPGDAFSHGDHAWFLMNRRRTEECLREIETALDLDPLMPLFYAWAVGLYNAAGRPAEAIRYFERAVELDPTFGLPYFHGGMAYFIAGQPDRAVEALRQGLAIAPHPGWAESAIAIIRLAQGQRAEAEAIYERMREARVTANVSAVTLAWAAGALGRVDEAFQWLERAISDRDNLIVFLHVYTPGMCPPVAQDPRFRGLLERLRLQDVG